MAQSPVPYMISRMLHILVEKLCKMRSKSRCLLYTEHIHPYHICRRGELRVKVIGLKQAQFTERVRVVGVILKALIHILVRFHRTEYFS